MTEVKIPRFDTPGGNSYTVHGVRADVIHELRKLSYWQNVELYVNDEKRKLLPGEQGKVEDRVYCFVTEHDLSGESRG